MRLQVRIKDQEAEQLKELSKQLYGKENTSGYIAKLIREHLGNLNNPAQKEAEPIKITTSKNNKTRLRSMQRTKKVNKSTLTPKQLQKMVDDMKQ